MPPGNTHVQQGLLATPLPQPKGHVPKQLFTTLVFLIEKISPGKCNESSKPNDAK